MYAFCSLPSYTLSGIKHKVFQSLALGNMLLGIVKKVFILKKYTEDSWPL